MLERPKVQIRRHPIYTGNYYIQTISIDTVFKEIVNWIDNRNPGGIIYGRARIGKTRAIHNLKVLLKNLYGEDLPVFIFNMSEHKPSEKFFFLELLKDIGHSFAKSSRTASELKTTLVYHLIACGKASIMSRVIIFIDEANFMSLDDYNYLVDVYNRLERAHVQLTVLLVGTEEIISTKTALMQLNKQQIIGRFMVRQYQFTGVRSAQDLQICMASYDFSEYPEDSGWSFTKYFFPEAFEEGERINTMAYDLFRIFVKAFNNKKIEIPMQYVTSTIENCYRKFGTDGKRLYFPSKTEWIESIADSGYVVAENLFESCTSL